MPKALKKTVSVAPQMLRQHSDQLVLFGAGVVALVALLVLFARSRRKTAHSAPEMSSPALGIGFTRFGRGSKTATPKQLTYLAKLVAERNELSAKQTSFGDWQREMGGGAPLSKKFASKLIKDLLAENKKRKAGFDQQKKNPAVGQLRSEFFVSDLGQYSYCERSAYFAVLQYPSQNVNELDQGSQVHHAYSHEEGRDPSKPSRVTEFIRGAEPTVERIEWLPNSAKASLRHATLPLTGRPDGFLHFGDGSRSVIELKTVAKLPESPYLSDFKQTDAYSLLASELGKSRDENFVLYMDRFTRQLALYKRKRELTEYDLARIITKIREGARYQELLKPANSVKKCSACGYRSICSAKSTG